MTVDHDTRLQGVEQRPLPPMRQDGRRTRVGMFVYNGFVTDARVTKEAATLTAAGYDVQVVAVLIKHTVPFEERDGYTVVRIERNPPHYRLLRRTRGARRRLRLTRVRPRRLKASIRRRQESRRAQAPGPVARPRRRTRRRLPLLIRRVRLPMALRRAAGMPGRGYGAVRWRLLVRSPGLRRFYYRRGGQRRWTARRIYFRRRAMRRLKVEQRERDGSSARLTLSSALGLAGTRRLETSRTAAWTRRGLTVIAIPLVLAALPLLGLGKGLAALGSRLDRILSRFAYRTVMRLHKPLMFTDYYRRAYRHALDEGFDVLHAHDLNTLPVAAWVAKRTGAPLIYDSHELYPEVSTLSKLERRVWTGLERRLITRARLVITVCDSIAGELSERYGIDRPRILLNCPPATEAPPAEPVNRLRQHAGLLGDDEPIVLYQGGFAVHRGLPELIEAARYLTRGKVVLMGWGALEPELRRQIEADDLGHRVILIGPASPKELLSFTEGADIGVIPYQAVGLNNYYTTPNKLFEYMAAGLPVVGSRLPELKRFVEGCDIGVIFDQTDARDLALAINYLLDDEDLLAQMSRNARAAGQRFIWEREGRQLLGMYDDLLGDRDARHPVPARRG